ncbi:hypothetical protein CEQ30_11500 [Nocardia brasiliensis]|nr:hypothetical protein CEQ30_11500 [Nocardia brasiliensis]
MLGPADTRRSRWSTRFFTAVTRVTPYLFRARGYQHTALHLRKLSPYGIFESFADQFEQIWGTVTPYTTTQGSANGLTA